MPSLALAFEYNGEYHYRSISVYPMTISHPYITRYSEVSVVQERDRFKQLVCKNCGIHLIVVPYWWDKTVESVVHTIAAFRPDTQLPEGDTIPMEIPKQKEKGEKTLDQLTV